MKTHSSAFDGLLSLIPAKYYYDDATQDQWQQKKKLKTEALEHQKAKFDPASGASADLYNTGKATAKEVMDNRAKTAKKVSIPQKQDALPAESDGPDVVAKKTDAEKAPASKQHTSSEKTSSSDKKTATEKKTFEKKISEKKTLPEKKASEKSGKPDKEAPSVSADASLNIDTDQSLSKAEASTSKSGEKESKKLSQEEQQLKEQRRKELKEKLASKITQLRESRKAPGTKNGGPVKSREHMLAERKRKQDWRRQEKLKRKREEQEQSDDDDDNSDDDDDDDDDDDEDANANVMFGNIEFQDGTRLTSDLSRLRKGIDQKKKKGPANKDIKAHLVNLEAKRRKLDQLLPEEKEKQQIKDKWLTVFAQAEGVKVKDNEKLLKRSLKRKEKQKLHSEIEWKERKTVVKDTITARQKRRDANLAARREGKGKKGKNQPRLRKFTGIVKKGGSKDGLKPTGKTGNNGRKRAGFEGLAKSNKGKK